MRVKAFILLIVFCLSGGLASAQDSVPDPARVTQLCGDATRDVDAGDGLIVPCVTNTHVLFPVVPEDWLSAIEPAYTASFALDLKAGVVLVCDFNRADCFRASFSLQQEMDQTGIAGTVWECDVRARKLGSCTRHDIFPRD